LIQKLVKDKGENFIHSKSAYMIEFSFISKIYLRF